MYLFHILFSYQQALSDLLPLFYVNICLGVLKKHSATAAINQSWFHHPLAEKRVKEFIENLEIKKETQGHCHHLHYIAQYSGGGLHKPTKACCHSSTFFLLSAGHTAFLT